MKKAVRLYLTGALQSLFFRQFVKENADKYNVVGFLRIRREDSKAEIFIQGNAEDVDSMVAVCKRGPKHAIIRDVEEKPERLQEFKEFKIFTF